MAFNDTLFQLGMDLTRSSTAQEEDFRGSARDVQEDCNGIGADGGDAELVGQKITIDLVGAKRLDSARVAETALGEAFEFAKVKLLSVEVRRMTKDGCLTGRATFDGGFATIEAWPVSGYVAVDVTATRGIRPELLLSALMDAFAAREATIKRGRTPMDGARYKKPVVGVTSVPVSAKPLGRRLEKPARTRKAA